jgi:hypothetical protein
MTVHSERARRSRLGNDEARSFVEAHLEFIARIAKLVTKRKVDAVLAASEKEHIFSSRDR